jgi:PAS domain S-box-containing protein
LLAIFKAIPGGYSHLADFQPLVWLLFFIGVALAISFVRRPKRAHQKVGEQSAVHQDTANDLFETAPIGYLEIDKKGIVRRVNRRECELRGLAPREILSKRCWDLTPPADRVRNREQTERRLSSQVALVPYQRKYLRPNGSEVTVEVHEQLLRNRLGQVVGMRLAAIDMTDRKKSEDEAYETATELRALFQAFPDLFLRLDRGGNALDWKGGQSSDPFLSPERFGKHSLSAILPAEVIAQFVEAQEKVRKTGAFQIVEFALDGRPGQQFYETRMLPLNWDQWIAVVRNITDRKAAEKKLKEYAHELERKNEEMESALFTAREATQLKSRFLANMSHEIRTPMNGVLGMTDFLLGTRLSSEQQEYAESIQRSAGALLTLINDILDLSKIEAGKLRLDSAPFNVAVAVEETASMFALQARAKGIEFVSSIPAALKRVALGDAGRLRQVLTNLLGNSIKFTEAGRIGVSAEILHDTASSLKARFTVHDTGIGISRDQQSRLFESFTQGDGSSTRKYGGTGLGLAISKQLVGLLGGEIGVASEPGRGSSFWFTSEFGKPAPGEVPAPTPQKPASKPIATIKIPARAPAPKPVPEVQTAPPVQTTHPAGDAKFRVLLAEDNEINQRITIRLLQKLGLAADSVMNGREAVEALEKGRYDLVFMDCQMPNMDGFEATAIVRSREGSKHHTPICALTANAMEGDRERCLAAGMDDYISKPVALDKLQKAVNRWLLRMEEPTSEQSVAGVSS